MQNNRPKQNYFDMNIRQNGDDFMNTMSPRSIQRSAKQRIFREMIKGEIDYSVYGKYFLESKFLENLIISANEELNNNAVIKTALIDFDLRNPGNNLVSTLAGKYTNLEFIYYTLYDRLLKVKQSGGNIGFLSDLSAVLFPYRDQI